VFTHLDYQIAAPQSGVAVNAPVRPGVNTGDRNDDKTGEIAALLDRR
jgi:hypothetical protein